MILHRINLETRRYVASITCSPKKDFRKVCRVRTCRAGVSGLPRWRLSSDSDIGHPRNSDGNCMRSHPYIHNKHRVLIVGPLYTKSKYACGLEVRSKLREVERHDRRLPALEHICTLEQWLEDPSIVAVW